MGLKSKALFKQALDLCPAERAALADQLLTSLDRPDNAIDEVWRKEIAARLRAYRSGTAETTSAEEILSILVNPPKRQFAVRVL